MKNIIHDYDGCLVNILDSIAEYLLDVHDIQVTSPRPREYDLQHWFGVDRDHFKDLMYKFSLNDGGYFGKIRPTPGAVEAVSHFRDAGLSQHVVTACNNHENTIAARLENSKFHFGTFDSFEFLDFHGTKEFHFRNFPKSFLIEDNLENALLGAECGHEVFLVDCPYNQTTEDLPVTRVTAWDEIVDLINKKTANMELAL